MGMRKPQFNIARRDWFLINDKIKVIGGIYRGSIVLYIRIGTSGSSITLMRPRRYYFETEEVNWGAYCSSAGSNLLIKHHYTEDEIKQLYFYGSRSKVVKL